MYKGYIGAVLDFKILQYSNQIYPSIDVGDDKIPSFLGFQHFLNLSFLTQKRNKIMQLMQFFKAEIGETISWGFSPCVIMMMCV